MTILISELDKTFDYIKKSIENYQVMKEFIESTANTETFSVATQYDQAKAARKLLNELE